MRLRSVSFVIVCILAIVSTFAVAQNPVHGALQIQDGKFQLNGKPLQIISGEMHYPRIPRAYWRERLRMAKAMGLNSITAYVFWNFHEPTEGVYDFSGNHDVAEFVREAQQEGLYVILRPGPYVCAEWELGGYPAWMLKDHGTLRSSDPKHMAAVRTWLQRLGKELAPLQAANGGPIIAVQVENEYGSFDSDHEYMRQSRQALIDAGFDKTLFYTADGYNEFAKGTIAGTSAVVNFAPGDAHKAFEELHKFQPQGPFMAGEYWDGWFDHWGEKHASTNAKQQADEIEWMLRSGYSISIYMFHGGTSFGWMNGANTRGSGAVYEPDVTSYDYDAALSESGQTTPKYFLFRDAIARATGHTPSPVPQQPKAAETANAKFAEAVSLWKVLPKPVHSELPLTMEDLRQPYGYVLYRTTIAQPVNGELAFDKLHNFAEIFVDGKLAGTVDRRLQQNSIQLNVTRPGTRLDILVENTGRVNFTKAIRGEFAGIVGNVQLAGAVLKGWEIFSLPMDTVEKLPFTSAPCTGPCFYRASLPMTAAADTFLDTHGLHKGELWVNGRAFGRFWNIGPQRTLYLPAPLAKQGANSVVIFDLDGSPERSIQGLATPILDAPVAKEAEVPGT